VRPHLAHFTRTSKVTHQYLNTDVPTACDDINMCISYATLGQDKRALICPDIMAIMIPSICSYSDVINYDVHHLLVELHSPKIYITKCPVTGPAHSGVPRISFLGV